MSKTQTKSTDLELTPVQESQSYKRLRMSDVRQIVAASHKQGKRIDLMGFSGDDIARSQIALQDLLSKEQEKHAKARGHIVDMKDIIITLGELMNFIGESSIERMIKDQEKLGNLTQALNQERQLHVMANNTVHELLGQNQTLTSELEDTMNTLRVALNGSSNG